MSRNCHADVKDLSVYAANIGISSRLAATTMRGPLDLFGKSGLAKLWELEEHLWPRLHDKYPKEQVITSSPLIVAR